MVRHLDRERPFGDGVRRVVRRRLDDAVDLLARHASVDGTSTDGDGTAAADLAVAVHDARRDCKEARALLRLATDVERGAAAETDRLIREAARLMAPVRDAHVVADLAADGRRPAEQLVTDEHRATIAAARARLGAASTAVDLLDLPTGSEGPRRGLTDTYRSARRWFERAGLDAAPERLQHWRIWSKRLWYQVRFLADTAPSVLAPMASLLDLTSETLGSVHDIDVLTQTETWERLSAERRDELVRERSALATAALRWGATAYVESPRAFGRRVTGYWARAVDLGPEPAP